MEKALKDYMVNQCQTIANLMEGTSTDKDRLFYFTALYGAAQRVMNIEYSAPMIHLYVVSQYAFSTINARFVNGAQIQGLPPEIALQIQGANDLPEAPTGVTSMLIDIVRNLGRYIEEDADFSSVLQDLCEVAYATTGNGFYLYKLNQLTAAKQE